ncbi:DEAD/DEAH box helicase [Hydromonas duriensis]|uniref:Superfamily II DNA/RNA helicase n=1 Tax=Hydromonas duriensis TaxID=1527608 RepID=A0A4R6YB22_9BURK|nr:DEAD/DEAH box helicase [Hydromonas duriensis]TDR32758.1 superfamily II DNA/RNA helicase [Hydromonas duriensis]
MSNTSFSKPSSEAITTTAPTITTFAEMNLAQPFLDAINVLGFTAPTPVQAHVVPAALSGGDWIVASQTGSGKTAAFLLPTLQQTWNALRSGTNNPSDAPYTLILCPTRELAQQVAADAINFVKQTKGIRIATVVGGTPYHKQRSALKGAHLVVATPGRLLDWIQQGGINLSRLHTLVLDEADRMLDLGFMDEITSIHEACEHRQQTLMFSATFTARETRLAGALMAEPQRITLATAQEKHTNITQHLQWADNSHHQHQLLMHWLAQDDLTQAVVFASTQVETDRLADELVAQGISASSLHGAMPQVLRNRRLDALRNGRTKILVATDVAARGIDVPNISHVFNFGLPMKAEDYVHRIGRTGRAGREGVSVTFAQRQDTHKIRAIERYINRSINVTTVAGLEPQVSAEEYRARQGRGKPQRGRSGANSRGHFNDRNERSYSRPYDAKPRGDFGAPRREFDSKPRGEFGAPRSERADRPHSDRFERRAPHAGEPRRAFGGDSAPRTERAPRRDFDKPRSSFGDAPRREFDKPRRDFSAPRTDRPAADRRPSFGDKPRSNEGGYGKPRAARKSSY